MKDSWMLYDYLRRWWRILLLGTSLGAILGFAYYSNQIHPEEYQGTAQLSLYSSIFDIFEAPTKYSITIDIGTWSNEEAVAEYASSQAESLSLSTGRTVFVEGLQIDHHPVGSPSWKAIVLGTVLGGLLAIGFPYVWDDARAYALHRRAAERKASSRTDLANPRDLKPGIFRAGDVGTTTHLNAA